MKVFRNNNVSMLIDKGTDWSLGIKLQINQHWSCWRGSWWCWRSCHHPRHHYPHLLRPPSQSDSHQPIPFCLPCHHPFHNQVPCHLHLQHWSSKQLLVWGWVSGAIDHQRWPRQERVVWSADEVENKHPGRSCRLLPDTCALCRAQCVWKCCVCEDVMVCDAIVKILIRKVKRRALMGLQMAQSYRHPHKLEPLTWRHQRPQWCKRPVHCPSAKTPAKQALKWWNWRRREWLWCCASAFQPSHWSRRKQMILQRNFCPREAQERGVVDWWLSRLLEFAPWNKSWWGGWWIRNVN